MKENYIESAYAETWIENGIIYQFIKPSVTVIDINIAKQLVVDRTKVSDSKYKRPVLVSISNIKSMTREVKKYYNQEEPYEYLSATAMLVDTYVQRLIVHLLTRISPPPIPVNIFNNKEKALKWLEKYKVQNLN